MAIFYRGAGIGTWWHVHDARVSGFTPHFPGADRDQAILTHSAKRHIRNGTSASPFVSLTRSLSVAWSYAVFGGKRLPSEDEKAYIYEIKIDKCPAGLDLFDPLVLIANEVRTQLLSELSYQHDG
jgi:hypothetical protein